ncbi:MAG: glycosyltransferase family 39 protein, partial [Candidatus Daviesbacteria bacterium]|nr:glycosyltransferase family 39 protein [Candidatus Daviesbacteria bacterium]
MSKFKIAIILILLLAALLRFYNLPNSFVFAGDEEYQAILAQSLIKDFHIIWIGVNAAHLGFYLGPYWVYFTSFWLFLSKGDPLITGYISSFIGIATTLLIVLTGSALFNKKTGLMSGLLYAALPLMVFFDQKYWNPTPIPLLSIIMLLSLFKLKENPKWLLLFAGSFGLLFHTHLSLTPLIFVTIFLVIKQKIKLNKRIIFLSLLTFLLIITP